jgi:hypothetical protein
LSPACASWDQWKTFEERGDKFIEAVENFNVQRVGKRRLSAAFTVITADEEEIDMESEVEV